MAAKRARFVRGAVHNKIGKIGRCFFNVNITKNPEGLRPDSAFRDSCSWAPPIIHAYYCNIPIVIIKSAKSKAILWKTRVSIA